MNRNGDDDYEVQLIQLCDEIYEQAGKCEKGMKLAYQRNNECSFINNKLVKHDQSKRSGGSGASIFFSWAFLFSTAGLGYYAYTLHTKAARANVNLTDQEVGETKASSGVVA